MSLRFDSRAISTPDEPFCMINSLDKMPSYCGRTNLFLLVTILAQTFFTLVRGNLMTFSFFTAWHIPLFKLLNCFLCFYCQIEVNLCIDRISHYSKDFAHFEQPSRILGLQRY